MRKLYEIPETLVIADAVLTSFSLLQESGPKPATDDDLPTVVGNESSRSTSSYKRSVFESDDMIVRDSYSKTNRLFED